MLRPDHIAILIAVRSFLEKNAIDCSTGEPLYTGNKLGVGRTNHAIADRSSACRVGVGRNSSANCISDDHNGGVSHSDVDHDGGIRISTS